MSRVLEGEVSQVIPPEMHDEFAINRAVRERAEGLSIVVVTHDSPDGLFERVAWTAVYWLSLFRVSGYETSVVLFDPDEAPDEGETVTVVDAEPATTRIEDTYVAGGVAR